MNSISRKFMLVVSIAGLLLAYNNCGGRSGLWVNDSSSEMSFVDNLGPSSGGGLMPEAKVGELTARLQIGDQIQRSFESVTGVPASTGTIRNEYNARSSSMAGQFDVQAVTSPMMIAVSSVASRFCETAITSEANMAAASRRLFVGVNFTQGPAALSGATFDTLIANLAQKFWGRTLTTQEQVALTAARDEFVRGFATNVSAANQTRGTVLLTCTAMLSTFDMLVL